MPTVLVGGPFGRSDPGAEAQLTVFRSSFPDWRVIALSTRPQETANRHGCEALDPTDTIAVGRALSTVDALVFLGDEVFNPGRAPDVSTWVEQARALTLGLRKSVAAGPLVFLGAGVSLVPNGTTEKVLRTLIRRSSLLVLRDEESAESLSAAGLPGPFRVGSDIGWLVTAPARRVTAPGDGSVLVVVSHHQNQETILRLPSLLAPLTERRGDLRLQPWQRDSGRHMDMSLAGSVSAEMGDIEVLSPSDDLGEIMERMTTADVVMCTNVHSLIAAALAGAPAVAVGNDPQVVALARRLGQEAVPADSPASDTVETVERARPASRRRIEDERTAAGNTLQLLNLFLAGVEDRAEVPQLALQPPPWTSNGGDTTTEIPEHEPADRPGLWSRSRLGGVLAVGVMVMALLGASLLATALRPPPSDRKAAMASIERFFDGYVNENGRVVRPENGGDTTSEGQSYAMLLALAAGDRRRFDRVWNWTNDNLRQANGSLAWHWGDGTVLDPQPAPDADLDTAMALVIASDRFDEPEYRAQGLQLAEQTLNGSTVKKDGRLYLTAGPWANGPPTYVNPSYQSFRAFDVLATDTSDRRWRRLGESGTEVVNELTETNTGLVPDWGQLGNDGALRPVPKPGSDQTRPTYGFDAARTPIRLFHSCDPAHLRLAASLWPFLENRLEDGSLESVFSLDGRPLDDHPHPTPMIGAAAAAAAAGELGRSRELLDEAARLVGDSDSYGAAWIALGRVILTTNLLGGCPSASQPQLSGS